MESSKTYNPDLKYPELSHTIIGAAFEVHNSLGPGWDEWDYHRAMLETLRIKGLQAESHLREALFHRNDPVDQFELDIVVEGKIILELKHIRNGFSDQHYTQIINYLKCWGKDLGILINFGLERLCYKRVPYTPVKGEISLSGHWREIEPQHPELTKQIVLSAESILEQPGLGYGKEAFGKILFREFTHQNLAPKIPEVAPRINGLSFESRPVDAILLNNTILVSATVFDDTSATDMARLQSRMKQLSISGGVLINAGKLKLSLRGITLQLPHS